MLLKIGQRTKSMMNEITRRQWLLVALERRKEIIYRRTSESIFKLCTTMLNKNNVYLGSAVVLTGALCPETTKVR